MLTLITLTDTDGTVMDPINADSILAVRRGDDSTFVDVVGSRFALEVLETPDEIQTLANASQARSEWQRSALFGNHPDASVLANISRVERAVRDAVKQRLEGNQNTL